MQRKMLNSGGNYRFISPDHKAWTARGRVATRRAAIDALEPRRLLASIVVNTVSDTVDANPTVTSLREAITAANSTVAADTITFKLGGGAHTINLGSELPHFSTDMEIKGADASLLSVQRDAIAKFRIFTIDRGCTVSLLRMTISNGAGGNGGGILNAGGTLNIESSIIRGNIATDGGGIFSTGTLTVRNSTLSANSAVRGGGMRNQVGTATLFNCTLSDNTAFVGGAIENISGTITLLNSILSGNAGRNASGGAIFNDYASTFAVRNCTITGNAANGGAGITNAGSLTVEKSVISDNHAVEGAFGPGVGAGIFNQGTATISHCTLSGNDAANSVETSEPGQGGGVYNAGTLTVTRSTLSGNTAGDGGGIFTDVVINGVATVTVDNTTLSGNSAGQGGAILSYGGTVTIQSSTLSGNSSYRGGAVYTSDGTVDITNSALTTNTASGEGAGIYMEFGVLTILRSTLADNSADGNGGGIYTNGTFSIQSSTLSGNTAWGSGGGILNSGGEGTIVNSTLNGNSVAEFYGGAIFNAGPMTISNSTISDNHAAGSGGIYQDPYPGSPLTLKNSIVALNTSASHFSDITGPFTGNFNFIGTDHPGVDPKLGPLANNGGPTKTMALLPGSPCLNAGDPAFSGLDFDQRGPGYGRVVFSRIDIGAYELQTPKRRIEDLINRVKELGDHEDDNREHGDELVNPLEGALRKLSRNEKGPTQAAKLLESFIKQIEQQIKGLRTSDSDYASDLAEVTGLKTEAQSIIEQLLAA